MITQSCISKLRLPFTSTQARTQTNPYPRNVRLEFTLPLQAIQVRQTSAEEDIHRSTFIEPYIIGTSDIFSRLPIAGPFEGKSIYGSFALGDLIQKSWWACPFGPRNPSQDQSAFGGLTLPRSIIHRLLKNCRISITA